MSKSKFADDARFRDTVNKFIGGLHDELKKQQIPLSVAKISFNGHPDCNPGCQWICSLDPNGNPTNCHCEC